MFQLTIQVKIETFAFDFAKSKDVKEYQPMIEDLDNLEVGILINNVGIKYTHPELLHGMKDDLSDISNIIAVNTMPVTLLTSALLPQMVQRKGGVVVNISSFSGLYPMSHWSVYSSTKQYVRWLSDILRQEYARKGIIVQTICPIFVISNMTRVDLYYMFHLKGQLIPSFTFKEPATILRQFNVRNRQVLFSAK